MANLFIAQTVNFYFKHFQVIKGKTSLNLVNLSRTSYLLEKKQFVYLHKQLYDEKGIWQGRTEGL